MDSKRIVESAEYKPPLWQRLGWMVMIYVGSVAALGVFAMLIRLFMQAAGMRSH
ncbi:DUF2474 domain-containing protein [Pseudomonas sp. SWRI79]|uniref:DUF2474 domain-containing protein n=1 Tax=Pseudomonas farris TaxID=2841207 RepID=A0ABS6PZJ6_9PSED|nr:DUF2474 domain-containing protein [Pseudomonas farris]MBV4465885.1 DUF2474 domain-containing protein [Pseudomonas farris]